jgi:hypothetical protein
MNLLLREVNFASKVALVSSDPGRSFTLLASQHEQSITSGGVFVCAHAAPQKEDF